MSVDPFDDDPDPRWVAEYDGVCVDNKDPLLIGRIRFRIPGLIDPMSAWAFPIGMPGGGGSGFGIYHPPKIGAEVACFFKQGDPDRPRYMAGPWGAPDGPDSPTFLHTFLKDVTKEEADFIAGWEVDRYQIIMDSRPGKETLIIRDKNSPDTEEGAGEFLEIDSVNNGITISGTTAVLIKSKGVVNIQALQVQINGRIVRDTDDPI